MSQPMPYRWRRSPRARQLQVRITPWQGIEVVIPARTSKQRVRSFLSRHRQWIRDTWARMRAQIADAERTLPASIELRALGERWQVRYRHSRGGRAQVKAGAGQTLTVFYDGHDESACRRALRRWLALRARAYFGPRVQRCCREGGFHVKRLQIRGQKSRWGSCSSNRTLSLNYKLLFLSPELVRYLLVHELAHTRVLDHSTRFWRLVESCEPRWKELDRELGEAWRDVPAWVEMP